jgi:hypothetical protein
MALLVGMDDEFQQDTGFADAEYARRVFPQRDRQSEMRLV